jgi:TPR repeat protein
MPFLYGMQAIGIARLLRRIELPPTIRRLATRLLPQQLARAPIFLIPDLANGLAALEAGEVAAALRHLRPLALEGVVEAEYRMGIMCLHGIGLVQDFGDAVFWLTRAADQGHVEAQSELGMAYITGSAAPAADCTLMRWHQISAKVHEPVAKANLIILHPNGLGLEPDVAKGLGLLKSAAAQEVVSAQLRLGIVYADATYGVQNIDAALAWFRAAAECGNVDAQFKLGAIYARGQDTKQDFTSALDWFRKAADQGHIVAMFNLGLMHASGYGCERDISEAIRWYRKAAEAGDTNAQFNLGLIHANGLAGQHDYAAAIIYFIKAAERGNVSAQFNLGLLHANGIGCPRNIAEGTTWYRKAAAAGNEAAQVNLGLLYLDPKNPTQDAGEAAIWFQRAAQTGNVLAQFNLGMLYAAGDGVRRDDAEAARLLALAAGRGSVAASVEFARLVVEGRTSPDERILAYGSLFSIIETLSDDRQRNDADGILTALTVNMSEDEIQQAKDIAFNIIPENSDV